MGPSRTKGGDHAARAQPGEEGRRLPATRNSLTSLLPWPRGSPTATADGEEGIEP